MICAQAGPDRPSEQRRGGAVARASFPNVTPALPITLRFPHELKGGARPLGAQSARLQIGTVVIKEARALHSRAVDSLSLGVDHFNRVWSRGRTEAVLIFMDRAFELLLKSIIVHKGGAIRETRRHGTTIGFDACLRRCLSNTSLKCITEDEAITLRALNTLRDAAQHYLIEVSDQQLYVYAQSAVTLFLRLSKVQLGLKVEDMLPERALPVSAKPPSDLGALFATEFADIKAMVRPGSRKRLDAKAKLRSLAVLQASLDGRRSQPSDGELEQIPITTHRTRRRRSSWRTRAA